jgi:non-ribosomal peptide synthetase component F
VSYADLEDRVRPLVGQLLASGARPECPVLVYARHGAAAVAAHLAVARAGACCVPVDANQSPVRIAAIADRSAARLIVGDREVPPIVGHGRHVITIADRSGPTGRSSTEPIVDVRGDNLAYVLYRAEADHASDPVAVSYAELARLVEWRRSVTGTTSRDHVSSAANHGRIEWLWEVWSALTAGATLEIVPPHCTTAEQHVEWLTQRSMSVAHLPTRMTAELLESIERSPASSIRAVVASDAELRRAAPRSGRIALINVRDIAPPALTMVATTIGTEGPAVPAVISAAGASEPLLVLDEQLAATPAGFSGSLFVEADPAARGVDARATAATYVPHPRPMHPGDRLIETGRRVRVRSSPYLELFDVQGPQGRGTPLPLPFCAPRTALEEIVADAWRDVLSMSQIGIHDDFNDLGGDSLLAIRIVSRVVETIDRDVPVAMLLDHPTVAAFSAEIERSIADRPWEQLAPVAAGEQSDR